MASVDDRLNSLETEITILKGQLAERHETNWIDVVAGSFRDQPEFDEVLRLGREARRHDLFDGPNGSTES